MQHPVSFHAGVRSILGNIPLFDISDGHPAGCPFCLAAAAIIIATATVTVAAGIAAPAEQNQQNNDPAKIAAKPVITHMHTSENHFHGHAAHSKIFRRSKNVKRSVISFPTA